MIKMPFSWFGSKRKIAHIIWSAFGNVPNYVDPFAGSLATLFANPNIPKIETVNDIDCGLTNFWRAVSLDPESIIKYADNPVNELDLHARHIWLQNQLTEEFKNRLNSEPEFFDPKMAGYWVWGQSTSVGNNWLQPKGLKALPLLSSAGGGINGLTFDIKNDFIKLQQRLRKVRVCCGDWSRVVTPSVTYNSVGISSKDITAVLLDPPYPIKLRNKVYKEESNLFDNVFDWARLNGDNPRLRIAVCGYDGPNYVMPESWQTFSWKADGGLSSLGDGRGKENSKKETIWFSPYCLKV